MRKIIVLAFVFGFVFCAEAICGYCGDTKVFSQRCSYCNGSGYWNGQSCNPCKGNGFIYVKCTYCTYQNSGYGHTMSSVGDDMVAISRTPAASQIKWYHVVIPIVLGCVLGFALAANT